MASNFALLPALVRHVQVDNQLTQNNLYIRMSYLGLSEKIAKFYQFNLLVDLDFLLY